MQGLLIRKRRQEREWSQAALCNGICAVSYLSKIEQGKVESSPEVLDLLFRRLDIQWQDDPAFFREDRPHLRELAETLQALEEGTLKAPDGSVCRRLAISEPPRHGKSYTMTLFNQWCFGRNPQDRIINVSYNELLSGRFSKGVRDGIDATKIDP